MAGVKEEPKAFWRGGRGVRKAQLVSRHLTSDFIQQHYEVVRRLNSGSFAHVNLVRERATNHLRVCKVISIKDMDPHVLGMMRKEVQVLSALDHPNIVRLYEFAEDEKRQELVLVLEYVPGGDCIDLLEEKERLLPEQLVARLIYQLLVVLNYCHQRGITHRDVKPENLMLSSSEDEYVECKVIDFGLATPYKGKVKEFAGTVSYLSPELAIAQEGFSMAADIWAVAATAFELLTGVAPFGKPQEFDNDCEPILDALADYDNFDQDLLQVFRNSPGHQQLWRSSDAKDFLRCLLVADPKDRPSAAQALQHRWLLRHRPEPVEITSDVLQSLVGFAKAPQMHRSCLYALAAKGADEPEIERFGEAFVQMDRDGDGRLSHEDVETAIKQAKSWWTWSSEPDVDVEAVFLAAAQDGSKLLGYTDFIAACLFSQHDVLDAKLLDLAFCALDGDRDGLLKADEVQPAFPEYPRGLPKYCAFKQDEWRECVFQEAALKAEEIARKAAEDQAEAARREAEEAAAAAAEPGVLRSLMDRLLLGGCRSQNVDGEEVTLGTPKHMREKVEKLRTHTACQLPATMSAAEMVAAARASFPTEPAAASFPMLQANVNHSASFQLQAPKGILPNAGPSFASSSTFASLSSMQNGHLLPSQSSYVLGQ
eukprot:TRINITY_DN47441_c0_g1_i1.p1 TRINITY_DN47441_c0_g1~~TRINITY_DN47441_c0_g1_i1.p1  ORF type:complete len:661 (+),score=176.38 TRINITY_DN47441_c0_g1_i1:25-1983(+)